MSIAKMRMNRLAPWFGADLAIAETAAKLIGKRSWVGIPFAGGCSIIPFIETRGGLAADLHRHIINLATVIKDESLRPQLIERLDGKISKSKLDLSLQRYQLDRIEHAEAIANHLERNHKLRDSWSGAFLAALDAGPDEWPLPPGVLTHSEQALRDAARREEQQAREQAQAKRREIEQAARAWYEAMTWDDQRALFDSLPIETRRQFGNFRHPFVPAYLYQCHRNGTNGNGNGDHK